MRSPSCPSAAAAMLGLRLCTAQVALPPASSRCHPAVRCFSAATPSTAAYCSFRAQQCNALSHVPCPSPAGPLLAAATPSTAVPRSSSATALRWSRSTRWALFLCFSFTWSLFDWVNSCWACLTSLVCSVCADASRWSRSTRWALFLCSGRCCYAQLSWQLLGLFDKLGLHALTEAFPLAATSLHFNPSQIEHWPQVEFNKAALSLADAFPADQKKAALNRLLKVSLQMLLRFAY